MERTPQSPDGASIQNVPTQLELHLLLQVPSVPPATALQVQSSTKWFYFLRPSRLPGFQRATVPIIGQSDSQTDRQAASRRVGSSFLTSFKAFV